MLRDAIPSRDADYSFYIVCECGKELLHFTYFAEDVNCEEIISIKYYGPDCDQTNLIFTLNDINLRKLSDHFKLSLSEETYSFSLDDTNASLIITKDALGFYIIKRKQYMFSLFEDWEICLRDFEIKALVKELDKMYNKIFEIREQNKLKAEEQLLAEKIMREKHKKLTKNS